MKCAKSIDIFSRKWYYHICVARITGIIFVSEKNMRKCRNWQTSKTKDLVVATPCGFKSHLSHEYLSRENLFLAGFLDFFFLKTRNILITFDYLIHEKCLPIILSVWLSVFPQSFRWIYSYFFRGNGGKCVQKTAIAGGSYVNNYYIFLPCFLHL